MRFCSLLLCVAALLSCVCFVCASIDAPQPTQEPRKVATAPASHTQDRDQDGALADASASSAAPKGTRDAAADTTAADEPRERVVAIEIRTGDYDAQVKWDRAAAPPSTGSASVPTLDDRLEFVERMQATLDTLLARLEAQGTHSTADEQRTIEELRVLIEEAAPLMTADLLQQLPQLYEQFVDAQTLAEDMLLQAQDDDGDSEASDSAAAAGAQLPHAHDGNEDAALASSPIEPSDAFLDLEELILLEGVTDERVAALHALASKQNDMFAHEMLAFLALFEPNAAQQRDFTAAFRDLRLAADAGLPTASGLLAMLSLIEFGEPRNASVSSEERRLIAEDWLLDLAREQDFMASLVVGYRMLTGTMTGLWKSDTCSNAVRYYHRCAQSNVNTVADQGGERPYDLLRLSEEFVAPGAYNDELREDAVQRFEYFRSVAGNPADEQWAEATQRLGEMYYFGDDAAGVPQDHARAAEHFRVAAAGGEPLAQANYGMLLANGIGVKQDNATALRYLRQAAAQGSGFAMYGIGLLHLTGGGVKKNETAAVKYFEKAVALGYTEAHTHLGTAYLHGTGVTKNETLAFYHFEEAATTEASEALFNLGVMYYRGAGTKRSCTLAVDLFRRVAVNPVLLADLPFSMEKAYDCYQQGDYMRAYLQYRLLSEFGSEEAQVNAAFLLEQFGSKIFPARDAEHSESAARPRALWRGEPRHPLAEALALYERAAWLNDTEAIRKTGACYYDGWDNACEKNATRAVEQYARAADLGDSEAAYNCGAMYTSGDGIARDLDAARRFFTMCSEAYYPANVPCTVALTALDFVLTVRNATRGVLAPLWATLSL